MILYIKYKNVTEVKPVFSVEEIKLRPKNLLETIDAFGRFTLFDLDNIETIGITGKTKEIINFLKIK